MQSARDLYSKIKSLAFGSLSTLLFFVIWYAASATGLLNDGLIPDPVSVVLKLFRNVFTGDLFSKHILLSFRRAGIGFLASGAVGLFLGCFLKILPEKLRMIFMPVLQLFEKLNPLALFPVFMLFFGIGEMSKVMIVFCVSVWQIAFHTLAGLMNVDPVLIKSARAMGASRFVLFWRVYFPAALPDIFGGIKFGAQTAFVFIVTVEMLSSSAGLGWFLQNAKTRYDLRDLYSSVIIVALIGIFISKILTHIEVRLFSWKEKVL
ncbi:MAG: ABC transporter permease [Synergistaceae bacterium]|jgi:NitT/TauT family transport system permease protein|nr:ABC transporter permease [Synergistaceae bacterium]